jgi:hypothetical protein
VDEIQGLDLTEMGIEGYYRADPVRARESGSVPPSQPPEPPPPRSRQVTSSGMHATRPTRPWGGNVKRGA